MGKRSRQFTGNMYMRRCGICNEGACLRRAVQEGHYNRGLACKHALSTCCLSAAVASIAQRKFPMKSQIGSLLCPDMALLRPSTNIN